MLKKLTSDRMTHSLMVARKMKEIANELYPDKKDFKKEMFVLGLVHDIGYEFCAFQPHHGKVGGEILKKNKYKYWREVYWHGRSESKYKSKALDILNIADLLTDAKGNEVTVEYRLEDVRERYGEDSFEYKDFTKLAIKLGLIHG